MGRAEKNEKAISGGGSESLKEQPERTNFTKHIRTRQGRELFITLGEKETGQKEASPLLSKLGPRAPKEG